jgi:hypothetical protein
MADGDTKLDPPLGGGEPKRCGAKKRQFPFTPCEQPSGWGTDHPGIGHCRFHGGSTSSQRTQAMRQRIHDEAVVMLGRTDLQPIDNPLLELQKFAAEVIAFKDILGDKVEELRGLTYDDLTETEQVRAILMAYERALDRTNTVLSGIVRLNIEERTARLSELQAQLMIQLFEAVIEAREMQLTREQKSTARTIVAREIPRVTTPAA